MEYNELSHKRGGYFLDINLSQSKKQCDISDNYTDYMLCLALDIGEAMLVNGAEVHRVENTVSRLCRAYGAEHTEIFVIPSVIIAAVRMGDGSYSSQMRRVESSGMDLYKVELYNKISRKACKEIPPLFELEHMILETKNKKSYPYFVVVLGAALATGSFAVFFGGTWRDAVVAAIIGMIMALGEKIPFSNQNQFAKVAIQSFVAGTLAYVFVLAGVGLNVDEIMMGTIMYSIPGLALGIAARDFFLGDFIAGALKTIHVIIVTLMIAFGYSLAFLVFRGAM